MVLASLKILLLGIWGLENIWAPEPQNTNKSAQITAENEQSKPKVSAQLPLNTSEFAHAQDNNQSSSAETSSDLSAERKKLLERRKKLDRREKELNQLEKEIDQKLSKLKETEQSLQNLIEKAGEIKDEKIKHLVDVYANMEPQSAAAALETLSEDIAVKILSGMRGRQAGEILSNVNSQKAATLSEALTEMQTPFAD